uniref:Uncharacterized protein n=1 Tax=Molossus molossus TaxID=27622 RepID=A0A7J8I1V4_MOLMO|nr:hypothetical protein HJG59_010825 [Molossus molossus]
MDLQIPQTKILSVAHSPQGSAAQSPSHDSTQWYQFCPFGWHVPFQITSPPPFPQALSSLLCSLAPSGQSRKALEVRIPHATAADICSEELSLVPPQLQLQEARAAGFSWRTWWSSNWLISLRSCGGSVPCHH